MTKDFEKPCKSRGSRGSDFPAAKAGKAPLNILINLHQFRIASCFVLFFFKSVKLRFQLLNTITEKFISFNNNNKKY